MGMCAPVNDAVALRRSYPQPSLSPGATDSRAWVASVVPLILLARCPRGRCEIIGNKKCIIADEPTSGLDSFQVRSPVKKCRI
jgi:hypothetical protein